MARPGGNIRTGDFNDKHVSIMEQMHEKDSTPLSMEGRAGLPVTHFLGAMHDASELISQLLSYGLVFNHTNAENEPINRYSLTELGERKLANARKSIEKRTTEKTEDQDGARYVDMKPRTTSSRSSRSTKPKGGRTKVVLPKAPTRPKGPISKTVQARSGTRTAAKKGRHPDDQD